MRFLLGLLMLVISGSALATIDVMQFKDEAQEQQFRQLTEQLRCPKCQNNSIADSNSMIATDLRQKVYELMQEGKSQKEIVDYMVARYGNFVTYDPPLTPLTVLLWVMPVVAIGLGGWIIFARTRRRVRVKQEEFPDDVIPDGKRGGFGLFVPGIVVALGVGAVSYYETGNYKQVQIWQQATAQAPALLERALDPKADPLNEEDMTRLALGLRTRLQADPTNVEGWIMLGRIGMVLGNASTATEAYANAYRLDPKNSDAALGYAEALTRSSDPDDNRRGGELLRQLVRGEHANVRVLSMYAFNAFEQQRFGEAVAAWEMMLKLLPANDTRRAVIERSIKQAMEQLTPQEK
ncbi:cytochrome c-type biogenesis protein CcmH [Citrobacter freundii complex sp. 2024EL-00228]|jgi:cytochrome c-type biogenesis protein CcmH|uniref:Cytochrome c-type biogenesis protein n=1 Tax=Citrobacter freundii TaxID=546 RepID=A0A9P3Z2X5_CITFR|nr:cytochrome c-type biogenesis protein CcmH [Citrobacter freundii]EJC8213049.1 cytochrome c-type biogenesis protein CcmH [Citrobacter freundii]ELK7552580.1 cytochrome c-type biogenesis protein CcmH [Citrobacter freundii]MBJ9313219.1 cytochrome c-type biogenesis protein CcmH [Citrobacter freundii]MDH1410573.1 cytochrome c-type biogenesis protein CcmH [Citrobacter freundii]STB09216.1 cytochrome C-type biogenesis protein [Citrobacter freundii]